MVAKWLVDYFIFIMWTFDPLVWFQFFIFLSKLFDLTSAIWCEWLILLWFFYQIKNLLHGDIWNAKRMTLSFINIFRGLLPVIFWRKSKLFDCQLKLQTVRCHIKWNGNISIYRAVFASWIKWNRLDIVCLAMAYSRKFVRKSWYTCVALGNVYRLR